MVFQERSLVGALSVAENVFAGRQPVNALGIIRRAPMLPKAPPPSGRARGGHRPAHADLPILSPGQQQMVEIAKGLSHDLKLHHPGRADLLAHHQGGAPSVRRDQRRLASQGVCDRLCLAPHGEIFEISDRVTVLKDGRVTGVRDTSASDGQATSSR